MDTDRLKRKKDSHLKTLHIKFCFSKDKIADLKKDKIYIEHIVNIVLENFTLPIKADEPPNLEIPTATLAVAPEGNFL